MAQVHLKAEFVRDLPQTESGQAFYFDTQTQGLGVRVGTRKKAYFAEGRVGAKKRRVTLGSTNALTLNNARKLAKKAVADMAGGIDPNKVKATERAASLTLSDALDQYLQDHDLKAITANENRRLIIADLSDWLDKDVKSFSPSMIVARFDLVSERSLTVANHVFRVLRALLNYARVATKTDEGEFTLPPNPCQRLTDLKRWHKSEVRTGRMTENQFPAFFQALEDADNPVFADYMELLVRTGMRRNEAASLHWDDVNLTDKTFQIRAEIAKNGQALTLPMSTQIEALFQRRRQATLETLYVFGDAKRYDPRRSLEKLREAVGANLTYHDYRRTFLTVAEEQAVPFGLLKKMGNHSAGNDITLKHYTNTVEHETLRPYMQKVNDQIDRLGGIYNEGLKIKDQIDRLRQVCEELEEFDQFAVELSQLRSVVNRLTCHTKTANPPDSFNPNRSAPERAMQMGITSAGLHPAWQPPQDS